MGEYPPCFELGARSLFAQRRVPLAYLCFFAKYSSMARRTSSETGAPVFAESFFNPFRCLSASQMLVRFIVSPSTPIGIRLSIRILAIAHPLAHVRPAETQIPSNSQTRKGLAAVPSPLAGLFINPINADFQPLR